MSLSLKEMELRDVKGGYYEVFLAFRGLFSKRIIEANVRIYGITEI